MRRRDFIALMGGGVAAWPLAARAAGPGPRIGVLDINSREYSERDFTAFRDGLQKLGYVEGKTADIDYRYANGDAGALPALAWELVELKPSVILAGMAVVEQTQRDPLDVSVDPNQRMLACDLM